MLQLAILALSWSPAPRLAAPLALRHHHAPPTMAAAWGGDLAEEAAAAVKAVQDARVEALLSRMSVERKVAQLIMPDISTITPEDVRTYRFGSVLNGGNITTIEMSDEGQ